MASVLDKIKFLVPTFAVLACYVFAGNGNVNYYGQLGVHKTQSAQTLGHGVFGLGFFLEGAGLNNMVGEISPYQSEGVYIEPTTFIGINGYPFLSLGLSDIFDFSFSIPLHGEALIVKADDIVYMDSDNLSTFGWGNLQISAKLRAPFNDDFPFDIALLLAGFIGTGRTDDHGLWVHDPAFLNINESNIDDRAPSTYTNGNAMFKIGAALTFDFNRMKVKLPFLLHLNGAYRMTLGQSAQDYPNVPNFSAALELTPSQYISIFTEYYQDFPLEFPKVKNGKEDYAATSTFTVGTSFHLSKNVDLQLGYQVRTGGDEQIDNLSFPRESRLYNNNTTVSKRSFNYSSTLIPKHVGFFGLTIRIFPAKEVVEEEEYRNPDTDEDGICDPWVAEAGRQREFSRECKGIDLCPYEAGPKENKGCPVVEEATTAPTILFTASPDVIQKGQSVTLSWQVNNAKEVSIEGIGTVQASGSRKVKPDESTSYTLTATGEGGTQTSTVEVEITNSPLPAIFFTASPETVQKGGTVTLTWQVTNATDISIEGIGAVKASGNRKVKVTENTSFTITAVGEGGTQTSTAEVEVAAGPLPIILFSINPASIQAGQSATLSWQVTNATEVSIEGIGKVQVKGTRQVKPTEHTVYTLTAVGEGGTQTEMAEVDVTAAPVIEARVNLQGVTFGSGNATLTSNAKKVLDGVAEQLLANPQVKIEIQGHTDNVGNPKSNQELSERRAKSVVGYLATKGVKMSRMSAVGYGQDVPIADNNTNDGREQNRRIEMIRVDN
jgi:outer membrane protein OmpA-like peptidoglycan-associated protein